VGGTSRLAAGYEEAATTENPPQAVLVILLDEIEKHSGRI
jgi:hypothetical protein